MGRFWFIGGQAKEGTGVSFQPRPHLDVISLDFEGKEVESVELENTSETYHAFLLAATAALPLGEQAKPLASSGEDPIMDKIGKSEIDYQLPVPSGKYLLKISLRNAKIGGILHIETGGNYLGPVAIAAHHNDVLYLPTEVTGDVLQLKIQSLPALAVFFEQNSNFVLERVEVFPLPAEETWPLIKGPEITVISGQSLIHQASLSQSVGRKHLYAVWGMDQLKNSSNGYLVSSPKPEQDIIFSFPGPKEINGISFSCFPSKGPKQVQLQIRQSPKDEWQQVQSWELSEQQPKIHENIPPITAAQVRLLMEDCYSKELWVNSADLFGPKLEP